MKPVARPEVRLFCQNPECCFTEESWRFRARVVDEASNDTEYVCPRCDSAAGLFEVKKSTQVEKNEEVVEMAPKLNFVVVDLERRIMKTLPQEKVSTVPDADILIPMLAESQTRTELDRRGRREFQMQLESLVNEIEGGLACLPEVRQWLQGFGYLPGAPEVDVETLTDDEDEPGGKMLDESEDMSPEEAAIHEGNFLGVWQNGYCEGFQVGFRVAMEEARKLPGAQVVEPRRQVISPASRARAERLIRAAKNRGGSNG